YDQILSGINNVIRTHINEMHSKFESQFSSMAMEVERRDALIAHLQTKLRTLELNILTSNRRNLKREKNLDPNTEGCTGVDLIGEDSSSSGSSAELLFMRGDSLDTVFSSSPPIQMKKLCTCSPKKNRDEFIASNYNHYCGNATRSNFDNSWSSNQPAALTDIAGNLSRLSDSVILDIGESTSSSSSSEKLNAEVNKDDMDEANENTDTNVHHNDWEVRMLAAEMEKQERKRGLSLSDNLHLNGTKPSSTLLRRRRKFSDTETEYSEETDADQTPAIVRPRASSLDQFNLRYGIGRGGIFKAMSIDRDKDKL
ncbi:hypothetical protein DOY81_009570, partial [Sarcophaga bullata]